MISRKRWWCEIVLGSWRGNENWWKWEEIRGECSWGLWRVEWRYCRRFGRVDMVMVG